MEIGDGIEKLLRVKIGQQHLEIAERLTRAAHDAQVIAGIESDGGHIVAQPPEAVLVHQIVVAIGSVVEVQALRLRMLCADVLCHAVDIPHQFHGVLESIGVHPLDEIGFDPRHARAVVADVVDLVGVVHVAHLDLLIGEKRAGDAEGFAHLQELAGDGGIHGMLVVHNYSPFKSR